MINHHLAGIILELYPIIEYANPRPSVDIPTGLLVVVVAGAYEITAWIRHELDPDKGNELQLSKSK